MPKANRVGNTRKSAKDSQLFIGKGKSEININPVNISGDIKTSTTIDEGTSNVKSSSPPLHDTSGLSRGQKKRMQKKLVYEDRMRRVTMSLNLSELRREKQRKDRGFMGTGMEGAIEDVVGGGGGGIGGVKVKDDVKLKVYDTNRKKHIVGVSEVRESERSELSNAAYVMSR